MANICYKNNQYLKQVIAKIDFATPLSDLTPDAIVAVVEQIKIRFPIAEQATAYQQGIHITAAEVKSTKTEFPEWIFHGNNREKTLRLNQHFIAVILTKYKDETDFKDDIIIPIKKYFESRPPILIKRTGIRFVNVYDFEIESIGKLADYFSEEICSHLMQMKEPNECLRSMLTNEFQKNEIKLKIKTGLFNPDYPSIIKRRHFVIDIDSYVDIPHQISNIDEYFTAFHAAIQDKFESFITDKMRDEILIRKEV